MPGSISLFKKIRKRDINIETGVAAYKGTLTYYQFNDPALNTFDLKEANSKINTNYKFIRFRCRSFRKYFRKIYKYKSKI